MRLRSLPPMRSVRMVRTGKASAASLTGSKKAGKASGGMIPEKKPQAPVGRTGAALAVESVRVVERVTRQAKQRAGSGKPLTGG